MHLSTLDFADFVCDLACQVVFAVEVALNALLKSTNTIYSSRSCSTRFSCSCLIQNIISTVFWLPLKPHCVSGTIKIVFVDFSKAFNAVGRTGLWQLLRKYGCPEKFTTMIEALHTGMMANVSVGWKVSESFCVTNGVKKSCLLAPRALLHLPISNGRRLFPRHGRWRLHTVQTDH